ncbi:PREDICTED: uncharacterized protein LOC104732726 [Camelina sativa]|uniref:Uncharacterized protein LOC104732726 n=1 Tax=Camelina sativa TaxID=90675 RepID=A0ABM0V4F7_CAMSA|nr:PREDICTED: uncharacterized protein LOC104732726 [Camelina sativa]
MNATMHKHRPHACSVLNPTQPPFMLTLLVSPESSYTVSTLALINIIINNLTELSSKEDKAEVKKVLKACKQDLSMKVPKKLSEAKTDLRSGDYDKAARSIMLALSYPWSCRSNLQSVKFDEYLYEESLELFSQINIYAQLSDAAMRIIDRF